MRRKPGSLVPLEEAICLAAADIRRDRIVEFHGYDIAKNLTTRSGRRILPAYGTLYRALGRLEKMGLLESRWEDPEIAAGENRPRRRLYSLTPQGETAAAAVSSTSSKTAMRLRPRWKPA
jgi:PadR family transcriptional regulator, regulatory protein PadR